MSDSTWGTVTTLSPLRIQLDGDTAALPFTPDSLIDPAALSEGDRVRCERSQRRIVIVGRAGGVPLGSIVTDVAALGTLVGRATKGVIPSSVAVGSGSASVAADGTVTFTGASSVALNGVFDGLGGDHYAAVWRIAKSAATTVGLRMRAAGANDAANFYNHNTMYVTAMDASTPLHSAGSALNLLPLVLAAVGGPGWWDFGKVDFFQPAKATQTGIIAPSWTAHSGGRYNSQLAGEHAWSAAYDGFAIIAGAGTLAGTVKVVKLS